MQETQGVASLALGYVLLWAFIGIIGCGSAIQASLIAFALHDDSARLGKIRNLSNKDFKLYKYNYDTNY